MKKIATYIILLATLGSAACSRTDEFDTPQHRGNELVVKAELVSASDWKTRSGASSEAQGIEYGESAESSDGQFFISATRQEWAAEQEQNTADAPLTRGTPITSASGITQMRVNVFRTGTSIWTTSSTLTSAVTANKSGNGYTTSPTYNWLVDPAIKTSLFAYSPVASSTNGLTESGNNKINYTVPTAVANQPDLCTATPKIDIVNSDGVQQIQTFALKHQLTAVGFSMLGWNLKITKITVSGVAVTGTLTMNSNGTTSWTTSFTGARDVGVTQSSYTHNHNSGYANITNSNGYLMMIPQTLSDDATVTITYESTATGSASGTTTAKLKDLGVTWVAGDKITYNIRLKTAPAVTSGDLKITTYKSGYTTSSPLTMFTDGGDKITFKWAESWLKIHMGNPIYGNPTSGNGVASQWTTPGGPISNIYFFATSDNTSTVYERTATITASGTRSGTKTFKVIQAKALPENSYIPTSVLKNGGWPTDKLPATGLQVAMRGNMQQPSNGTPGSDPKIQWRTSNNGTSGTSLALGTGKNNMNAMNGTDYTAAEYCRKMGSEWYIPSRDEFQLIYNNRGLLGSSFSFTETDYWTSSQGPQTIYARLMRFRDGWGAGYNYKTNTYLIRCVRNI